MAVSSATSKMQIISSGRVIRPLGPSEIYSSSRHSLGFYKCVINTCRYTVPSSKLRGRPLRYLLETAIANVVLGIPSLSIGIAGEETSKPHFVALTSIDLNNHFEYFVIDAPGQDQDAALIRLLERQHDRSWSEPASRPPWKATALSYSSSSSDLTTTVDILFAVHHSIADGRSTAAFHTTLLSELSAVINRPVQLSNHILNIPAGRTLAPPLEELIKFTQSWTFLLSTLWRELGPAWLQAAKPVTPWTGKPITRETYKTNLQLVVLSANTAKQVLAACRQHQTTLTPLLHALVLISLAKRAPSEDTKAFCSSTPIDLRPFVKRDSPSHDPKASFPFGVFITAQNHRFELPMLKTICSEERDDCSVWEIATGLRRDMRKHLEGVPRDDMISMLSWVSDWEKFWLAKLGKPRETTWEVSNLGSIVGSLENDADGWRIERSVMSQGATVGGAAIGVNAAGVVGGEICITLSSQEGIVESDLVRGLSADLQGWFKKLVEKGDFV